MFGRARKLHYQCGFPTTSGQRRSTRRSPRVIPHTRGKLCIGRNESEPERKALLRESGHTERSRNNEKGGKQANAGVACAR